MFFSKTRIAFEQAQKEVDDLHQRTKEGIETARLNGKQIGGVTGKPRIPKMKVHAKEEIVRLSKDFEGDFRTGSVSSSAEYTGIHFIDIRRNSNRNT